MRTREQITADMVREAEARGDDLDRLAASYRSDASKLDEHGEPSLGDWYRRTAQAMQDAAQAQRDREDSGGMCRES